MKIAVICPVGDLNRFGYWRMAQTCLESWRAVGDLFLIHSSRTALPFSIVANYMRNENTLMKMNQNGERFDHHLVANNANIGLTLARTAGYDAAITICVNWYVEADTAPKVIERCQEMVDIGSYYAFLYRRFQIGAALFDADLRSIAVVNLKKTNDIIVKVLVDTLEVNRHEIIEGRRDDFSVKNAEAYIDCEYEITLDEFKKKMLDVRNYEDILSKRRGADWGFWERYYRERAGKMRISDDAPGPIGQHIAGIHPAQSFGDWLLDQVKVAA